jgi:hypothetical protein
MDKTVVEKITEGIADAKDVKTENLHIMLENYVSTDAITALANHKSNSWRLQFETPNHVIEVTGNETVFVDSMEV